MNGEQTWLWVAAGGAVALVLLLCCALLWRNGRRLTARIDELEAGTATGALSTDAAAMPVPAQPATYLITAIDESESQTEQTTVVPTRIDGKLFADIVARETVIKAAGLVHGMRRALSPEVRNRIRFEMKREVKRSRKQRRADLKAALRQFNAREDAA